MKALSIQQPWAWLIVHGYKSIENRSWSTTYRGELLIHASQRVDHEGYLFVRDHFPHLLSVMPGADKIERGGIIGVARLTGVIHLWSDLDARDVQWFFGPCGFKLRDARSIPFRPLRGQLGLFEVPE